MENRYIVFDVETPNLANDRISAIGITVVEDGHIKEEICRLVNPQTRFDSFNIRLTKITPKAVADKGAFPELWEDIKHIMESGLLVAHNATFDMGVLAKCLRHYQISWQPYTYYACTCRITRACLPLLQNHRLDTLCGHLNIKLDHHTAGSDSRACAEILIYCQKHGININSFKRRYELFDF